MTEQIADPLRIGHVGLATRHGLDVLRIDDQQLEMAFEQIVDGLPINASAFHRDVSHGMTLQPIAQGQQIGHGAKAAGFPGRLAGARTIPDAGELRSSCERRGPHNVR